MESIRLGLTLTQTLSLTLTQTLSLTLTQTLTQALTQILTQPLSQTLTQTLIQSLFQENGENLNGKDKNGMAIKEFKDDWGLENSRKIKALDPKLFLNEFNNG
jgi:hypothetical protein